MKSLPPNLGRWVIVVFIILASVFLLYNYLIPAAWEVVVTILPWVLPFIFAWFLAALLDPAVDWLEYKARFPRTVASLVAVLVVVCLLVLVVATVISQLAVELSRLAVSFPDYAAVLREGFAWVDRFYRSGQIPPEAKTTLEASLNTIIGYVQVLISRLVQELVKGISSIPEFFISLVVIVVATFFFSRDKIAIKRGLVTAFPWLGRPRQLAVAAQLMGGSIGYVKAQSLLILITSAQVFIVLSFLSVSYAVSLSLLTAVLDVLPVVGPGAVFLPWALWALLTGHFGFGLALLILYATITIVRQILEPKIIAGHLGLHPLAALISIYVGIKAVGVVGAVLGPVTLVILKVAYQAGFFGFIGLGGRDGR